MSSPVRALPVATAVLAATLLLGTWPGRAAVRAQAGPPSGSVLAAIGQSYDISGTISYSDARVSATASVTLTNNSETSFDELYFGFAPRFLAQQLAGDGYAASVGPVTVDGQAASFSWPRSALMLLELGKSIAPGSATVVSIPFTVKVGKIAHSAFAAWQSRLEKNDGIAVFGNWFPVLTADHATGNLGDPFITWTADSIDLDLTLADPAYSALSRSAVGAGGRRVMVSPNRWVFAARNVRDLGFAVSPSFVTCRATMANEDATVLRAHAKSPALCSDFLAIARRAFERLSATWGPYPYDTLTVIQAAKSGYSMEYPTAVFIGAYKPARPIWHELAHQWFYGMLGNDQLREPWVDEAWAQFSEDYVRSGDVAAACGTANVNRAVSSFSYWNGCGQYTDTIYLRGARLVDAIRRAFPSNEDFYAAVRGYLDANRYRLVGMRDMLHYLDDQTDADLFAGAVCTYTSYC